MLERPMIAANTKEKTRSFQNKYAKFFEDGDTVLDVGCGNGVFLDILKKNNITPIGVDLSVDIIDLKKRGFLAYQHDIFSFLLDKESEYNGIFASHFIEHFAPDDVAKFFDLTYKSLKPGGCAVIITPNTYDLAVITQWFWLDPTHVRPYPLELVKALMQTSGFSITTAMEDKETAKIRGIKQRAIDTLRKVTTVGLAGRGDVIVVAKKRKK